uniref:Si:ch73-343l4.8 n=1 Tax=Sinocyclocheilus anshuiensis TaxID=1608454 RepID=A0A671P1L6_9TELE
MRAITLIPVKSYKNTAEEFNQTINGLQDSYTDLMTEKHQLSVYTFCMLFFFLSLMYTVLLKCMFLCGSGWLFMSTELKSWSDSRQDRGADLVIINTEEKFISSLVSESVWIGLSDTENEGSMKWVDNSPLKQGFWAEGEPNNNEVKNEDCIELIPSYPTLNNWNDLSCSEKKKGICEK